MRVMMAMLAATLAAGCDLTSEDDNTPVCSPMTTTACYCATGGPGEKTCQEDGLGYGGCACLPDAGVPDAGAPDADDTPPDAPP